MFFSIPDESRALVFLKCNCINNIIYSKECSNEGINNIFINTTSLYILLTSFIGFRSDKDKRCKACHCVYNNRKREFPSQNINPTLSNWQQVITDLVRNSTVEKVVAAIHFIRNQHNAFSYVLVGQLLMNNENKVICFCPEFRDNKSCLLFKVVRTRANLTNCCSECSNHSKRQSNASYTHLNTTESSKAVLAKFQRTKAELNASKVRIKILEV